MNGTSAAKSRRNLAQTEHRQVWNQLHSEDHPLRYRLHCQDGTYNFRCDRITLLAEIREIRPFKIERLLQKGDDFRCATAVEHLKFMGEMKCIEVKA